MIPHPPTTTLFPYTTLFRSLETDSVAITAEITVRIGRLDDTSTETFHEFYVDGSWRWVARDVEAYKQGLCPSDRSEEHTSELQSQSNLVCRLLLEKKKK